MKCRLALIRFPRYETIICRLVAQQLERVDHGLEPMGSKTSLILTISIY